MIRNPPTRHRIPPRRTAGQRPLIDWLLLAGFCGFLFFFGLAYFGLLGADEPRYAQVAREMLARHDWITPTLGGKPWLEKPALYYWQAMLAYSSFWRQRLGRASSLRGGCDADGGRRLSFPAALSSRLSTGWRADGGLRQRRHRLRAGRVDGHASGRHVHRSPCWPGMRGTKAPASATSRCPTSSWDWRCWPKDRWRHFSRRSIVVIFAAAKGDYRLIARTLLVAGHRALRF